MVDRRSRYFESESRSSWMSVFLYVSSHCCRLITWIVLIVMVVKLTLSLVENWDCVDALYSSEERIGNIIQGEVIPTKYRLNICICDGARWHGNDSISVIRERISLGQNVFRRFHSNEFLLLFAMAPSNVYLVMSFGGCIGRFADILCDGLCAILREVDSRCLWKKFTVYDRKKH